ncbi:MAG: glycosyltransferase, partial [Gammaproteobacteria bacterium]|nr:glycosyltransferase [Gammaproteobacteria bacterium]
MAAVKPYKILYHHRIASKDGQYVHVEEIIKALKAAGHQVCLVAPHLTEQSEFGSSGGLVAWLKARMPKQLYELMELSYAVVAFIKLLVAIYKFKPDFIYERFNLFLPAGVWASKCCKLPLLLEVNAPIYEERSKYDGIALSRLAQWSQHYCWKNADRCFPVTQVLAEY